jgi:phosphate transport system protein
VGSVSVPERDEFGGRVDSEMHLLFASVGESLGRATAALLEQDVELADQVIAGDEWIDRRCSALVELVTTRLQSGVVAGNELEEIISVLLMVPELERSADLAEHIAQRARNGTGGAMSPRCRGLIQSMSDAGVEMWYLAARAYSERSPDLSFELNEADDEVDNLSAELLKAGIMSGADPAVAAEVALIARFYERLGDHAVNLARRCTAVGLAAAHSNPGNAVKLAASNQPPRSPA